MASYYSKSTLKEVRTGNKFFNDLLPLYHLNNEKVTFNWCLFLKIVVIC